MRVSPLNMDIIVQSFYYFYLLLLLLILELLTL